MPHPETQIPMARPHPTPQKHDSPNANPNGTAQQTADLTKRCACAAKCITFLARHVGVMPITMELRRKLTRDTSMKSHLQKLPPSSKFETLGIEPGARTLRTGLLALLLGTRAQLVAKGIGNRTEQGSTSTDLHGQSPPPLHSRRFKVDGTHSYSMSLR